ncbi:MAG: c-type heme family protein [Flavobacteriales bacterium]
MSNNKSIIGFWLVLLCLTAILLTYLFATAPEPLVQQEAKVHVMSTEEALTLLAHENDVTRTLFTKAIVGAGKPRGLAFSEHWTDPDVIAGPLPALFLRGVASHLAVSEVPLGLYLGSDFPIESSNLFCGQQADEFAAMRKNPKPRHFRTNQSGEIIGMYPDWATDGACVSCHNEHERTSKTDWQLGDLMGATTWSYPKDSVSTDEFLAMLFAYRAGVAKVWQSYLREFDGLPLESQPTIGRDWPSAGHLSLPDLKTWQDSILSLSAPTVLVELMQKSR